MEFSGRWTVKHAAVVINDVVAVGSASGELYVIDAASGAQVWATDVGSPIEQKRGPVIGLGAGQDTLVVPASTLLAAYVPSKAAR
jgi:outer membrane protein assembly factor BamB